MKDVEAGAVHAQHLGHTNGRAIDAPAPGVQRLDHGDQPWPRHDALYLDQEHLAPLALLLQRVLGAGKLRWLMPPSCLRRQACAIAVCPIKSTCPLQFFHYVGSKLNRREQRHWSHGSQRRYRHGWD